MPGAARVSDKARVPKDNHDGVCCHHKNAEGPATVGSPDVNIDGKPALRQGDTGKHSHCCGKGEWTAMGGSTTVKINGKPAIREQDPTQHCGGVGQIISSTKKVNIGG
jgi:uncharacterized Zn-binding protein involved in type VI secretion